VKFTLEFGHRGKHSAARRAEALQEAVQALAKELNRAQARIEYLEAHNESIVAELNQLLAEKQAARARVKANQAARDAITQEIPVVSKVVPMGVVRAGKARFQLVKGGLEL